MPGYSAREDLLTHDIDGDLVIYDPDRDVVHTLNATARFVWNHCDGQTSPKEIASVLIQKYDVDGQTALRDISEVIRNLREQNLIFGTQ